ncbi:MAG: peptidylprolyl isomerase, partial [Chloroflexota bacterium]
GLLDGDEAAWNEWLNVNGYASEADFSGELRSQLLAARVRDHVVGDIPQQTTLQVQARHILVETEEDALMLRNRIINGEDFVLLAAQFSNDITTKDAGGDLGWFAREELLEPRVAEVAFTQEPGEISMPVATRLGYHIIETLQFDDLPVQPEKQAQIAQGIFDDWLTTETDSAIIEIYR